MHDLHHLGVIFSSAVLDPDVVRVVEIRGREQLGQLYEFRVRFTIETGQLGDSEVDQILLEPCVFTLGDDQDDAIHGVVREIELVRAFENQPAEYIAVVVPTVWMLTLSRISRVFQNVTVIDMAAEILTRFGLSRDRDFFVRVSGKLEKREFCVQFEESDWTFLQRWFEYEGLYYWFEHGEDGDKLVIADANRSSMAIPGEASLPYREHGAMVRTTASVFAWSATKRRIPARVVLKDYNEQNPTMPMVSRADADRDRGFGVLFVYGEHFSSEDAGTALAIKRAERCRSEQGMSRGRSDCTRFHVGRTFEMWNHFVNDQNGEYLLTSIDHYVGPIDFEADGDSEIDRLELGYRASFEALPIGVQFRPARSVAWPRIDGVMHAHVDSDTNGKFATLNGQGHYRVRLPFDSTGNQGGQSSNWVRMAQSYAGAGYGSHFPLHKGAEVLLAFIGGNPDRPIIVGAVPNAHTPSPAVDRNATQSIIQSAAGIRFVMEDNNPPSSRVAH